MRRAGQKGVEMLDNCNMRASDHDRERTVELLREAYAVGRLGLSDLRDQASRAYRAATWGDLWRLTADLPSWRPVTEERLEVQVSPKAELPPALGRERAPVPLVVLAFLAVAAAVCLPAAVVPLIILSLSVLSAAGFSTKSVRWPPGAHSLPPSWAARGRPATEARTAIPGAMTTPHRPGHHGGPGVQAP